MGEYSIEGVNFEWDDEKYQLNVKKHGVYFEDAAQVFFDDNAIYFPTTNTATAKTESKSSAWLKMFFR